MAKTYDRTDINRWRREDRRREAIERARDIAGDALVVLAVIALLAIALAAFIALAGWGG